MCKSDVRLSALDEVWEHVKGDMIKESLSKKVNKKLKALVPKLASMSDEIKRTVLKTYLLR